MLKEVVVGHHEICRMVKHVWIRAAILVPCRKHEDYRGRCRQQPKTGTMNNRLSGFQVLLLSTRFSERDAQHERE